MILTDGQVDETATAAERDRQRARRRQRSRVLGTTRGKTELTTAKRLDDNLIETGAAVACRHCREILGDAAPNSRLALAVYEGPSTEAGPQIIAHPADYIDAPVVFRQYCCLSCWTALYSGVVPAGHSDVMTTLGGLTATAVG